MRGSLSVSVVFLALAGACSGGTRAFSVGQNLTVVVDTSAPFADHSDFPGRVESTIQAALDYWGGSWADLRGMTLTISGADRVACSGRETLGCLDGSSIRVTSQDPSLGTLSCVEETVLVHEIGHAVIGDEMHEDPRWMQMDAVEQALQNRVGYTQSGDGPCPIYLSVWRHPLGTH